MGQDVVSRMTVRATRNLLRIAKAIVLAMIALQISINGDGVDAILLHQLMVGMTFLTDIGMKSSGFVIPRGANGFNFMKIMTIKAGSRIHIAIAQSLTMNRIMESFVSIVMTLSAFLCRNPLVTIPGGLAMNLSVTHCTGNFIQLCTLE